MCSSALEKAGAFVLMSAFGMTYQALHTRASEFQRYPHRRTSISEDYGFSFIGRFPAIIGRVRFTRGAYETEKEGSRAASPQTNQD